VFKLILYLCAPAQKQCKETYILSLSLESVNADGYDFLNHVLAAGTVASSTPHPHPSRRQWVWRATGSTTKSALTFSTDNAAQDTLQTDEYGG
jgi:hypothetical protein